MRATQVLPAGSWDTAREVDRVAADHDARHRRRIALGTESGGRLVIDLAHAVRLRDGDGLLLDSGGIVRIVAQAEPLHEIRATDGHALMRVAWHLGNRHLPVQMLHDAIRIRADHVIAAMVEGLGGAVREIHAPFDPEAGAYDGGGQQHHHHHGHEHDDDHPH